MLDRQLDSERVRRMFLAAGFIVLWFGMFSYIMNGPVGHDENMYVAAGILSNSQSLYADFAYLQMPYFPVFVGTVFKLTGTVHYLLWGRLLSFVCMVGSSILVYLISRKLSGSRLVAACMVALGGFNSVLIGASGYCWNSILPIPLALGAFHLFVRGIAERDGGQARPIYILFSGVLVSLAIGTKLLYVAIVPAFLVAALFYPRRRGEEFRKDGCDGARPSIAEPERPDFIMEGHVSAGPAAPLYHTSCARPFTFRQRVVRGVVPLLAGMTIGMLPVLYYLVRDIDRFMFNNLQYHRLNTIWYQLQGATDTMTLGSKVLYARGLLAEPSNMALAIGVMFTAFAVMRTIHADRREEDESPRISLITRIRRAVSPIHSLSVTSVVRSSQESKGLPVFLSGLLVLFSTALIFMISPLQNQYFAIPIPFAVLLIVSLYAGISEEGKAYARIMLVTVALVSVYFTWPRLFRYQDRVLDVHSWTPISVHTTAGQIREAIGPLRDGDVVATMSPLYVMEAGLPILKEFATGPFLFRVGDLIPAEKRRAYGAASASDIQSLFGKTHPKAIFVGFEPECESPWIEYAKEHNYTRVGRYFQGGTLYVR